MNHWHFWDNLPFSWYKLKLTSFFFLISWLRGFFKFCLAVSATSSSHSFVNWKRYPFSLPVMFELLNLAVFSDFYSFAATQPQFTDVWLCFWQKHKYVEFILASKLYQATWRQVSKKSCKSKPQKYKIPKIRPATEKVKVMFKVEVIQAKSNTKQQSRQGQVSKK